MGSRCGVIAAFAAAVLWAGGGSIHADDPPANAGPTYRLAYQFMPNQVVHYNVQHEMEIVIQQNGQKQTSQNKSQTRKHYQVVAVEPEGAADLELTLDRVHMTASVDDRQPEVFKSDDPAFHPAKYKSILNNIGKPQATIRFSPHGTPLKVLPVTPVAGGQAAVNNAESSDESYLTQLPDQPVAVGETWKERFQLPVLADKLTIKVDLQRVYRLEAVENNLARITFKTVILTPINDPEVRARLIQRETEGTIVFDVNRGLIVSRDVTADQFVINAFGPKSQMRAVSKYQERLSTP